jgi:hypothetical protein
MPTVANVPIEVKKSPVEGNEVIYTEKGSNGQQINHYYPTPRKLWPQAAHAPELLTFMDGGVTFKSLREDEEHLRTVFTQMAISMTSLGKGPHVILDTKTKKSIEVKARSIAYLDAIEMGESASHRQEFLGMDDAYSSCGMFVRCLYKMIGVKIDSYLKEYRYNVEGSRVMKTELDFAELHGALVKPGKDLENVTDLEGNTVRLPVMPKKGDAVYYEGTGYRHVQIVLGNVPPSERPVHRPSKDGKTKEYENTYYYVAQGGAPKTDQFPDDSPCMGINRGMMYIDAKNWYGYFANSKFKINRGWIDIYKLAEFCDDETMILPVRKNVWPR